MTNEFFGVNLSFAIEKCICQRFARKQVHLTSNFNSQIGKFHQLQSLQDYFPLGFTPVKNITILLIY